MRHPSILALPLLAAIIDMFTSYWQTLFTDPLGGSGGGLFQFVIQICICSRSAVRSSRPTTSRAAIAPASMTRGKRRGERPGGILMAAIGFQFVIYAAQYIGGLLGAALLQLGLQLIAYFFLILTIPAAAIGGLPGGLALSGSIRAVRANPLACVILAVVFIALWVFAPALPSCAARAIWRDRLTHRRRALARRSSSRISRFRLP